MIETVLILRTILLFFLQLLVTGGLSAFTIVSRMHEDKVFPREMRGSVCPRFIHRGRLHLILILVGLEVAVTAVFSIQLFQLLGSVLSGRGTGIWFSNMILPVVVLVVFLLTLAGFGLSSINPKRFAFILSYPLVPLYLALRPFTGIFLKIVSLLFPNLMREIGSYFFLFPAVDEGGEGFLEENGSRLMHSIVEFGVKKVREVMVPRIDVFALDVHNSIDEIRESVARAGHSRVPVYDGSIDRVVGILFVKDLVWVPGENGADIRRLVRDAYYVPESKKIDDLLREFQMEKKHMAIVVDEYGGTSGIVTLEDILEEIVGEIRDEYDVEVPLVRETGKGEYAIAGRVNIGELNEALKISIPSDEVDTLGGFLYNLVGRVPDEGEAIQYEGMIFRIERLDGQRIVEVHLRLQREGDSAH